MSMCRVFSCVVGRGCLLWPVHFLGKTLLVFALLQGTVKKNTWYTLSYIGGFPAGASGKESTCQCRGCKRPGFEPWVRKIPQRRKWQPTPVFLPGKFHGQRNLSRYSPWGRKESDTIERLSTHKENIRAPWHKRQDAWRSGDITDIPLN